VDSKRNRFLAAMNSNRNRRSESHGFMIHITFYDPQFSSSWGLFPMHIYPSPPIATPCIHNLIGPAIQLITLMRYISTFVHHSVPGLSARRINGSWNGNVQDSNQLQAVMTSTIWDTSLPYFLCPLFMYCLSSVTCSVKLEVRPSKAAPDTGMRLYTQLTVASIHLLASG
jgi:hypothetical protein